jgi:hypothetical protein
MNPSSILALVQFGVQVFTEIWTLFNPGAAASHAALPTTQAPALTAHLTATPGLTDDHKAVITSAVNTAASATAQKAAQ